tara:strand:- start:484 stop:651 length:168 start_codon:yes stop_codon:yes gene_type:complete
MSELLIGIIGMILLYLLGRLIYPDTVVGHPITPEPNKLLVNYGEAVGMVYGDEEE